MKTNRQTDKQTDRQTDRQSFLFFNNLEITQLVPSIQKYHHILLVSANKVVSVKVVEWSMSFIIELVSSASRAGQLGREATHSKTNSKLGITLI